MLPVVQFVAIAGTYGLGLLTVIAAAMPAVMVRPTLRNRLAVRSSLLILGLIALWGAIRMDGGPPAMVPHVMFRLVQANIEQTLKWKPDMRAEHLREHLALTKSPGFDLATDVIWPETAGPSFLDRDLAARSALGEATPPGGLLITGVVRGTPSSVEPFQIWNSLEAVDQWGEIVAIYDKAHLVPFGEYVPLRGILPLAKITAGGVDFTPGDGPATIDLPGLPPAGPLICYEVIFPGEVVDRSRRPGWLLNLTNDGWFGLSAGPYQHFAAARLRAVEEGLPLVRAANTGISAVVDPYGRVLAQLPLGTKGVLDFGLPSALSAIPPFAAIGIGAPLLLLLLVGGIAVAWRKLCGSN